jgi:hypothetical protein
LRGAIFAGPRVAGRRHQFTRATLALVLLLADEKGIRSQSGEAGAD